MWLIGAGLRCQQRAAFVPRASSSQRSASKLGSSRGVSDPPRLPPILKITYQGTPNAVLDDRKLERILQKPGEGRIDLRFEAEAETLTLALVPKRRLEDLELGLGRNVEPPHLPDGAEARQQLLADLRPGTRGHLATSIRRKALGNDLAMPVRDRNIFWMVSEMIPERLNVFQLLVRRELVEAGRWKRRLRHDASISSSHRYFRLAFIYEQTRAVRFCANHAFIGVRRRPSGHHATRFSGVPRPVKPLRFAPTPSGLAGLTAPAVRLA
jgi:hypothetical protein